MTYIGAVPTTGDFKKLDSITTSSSTTFNLRQGGVAVYPQSSSHCLVVLNGVLQTGGSSFNIVNDTIVFSESLSSSDVINQILVLGNVNDIGTPSDDTVSTAKIQANAVTDAKIADVAASKLTGTIATARLGSGTASSSTVLYGDNTFKAEPSGAMTHIGGSQGTGQVSNVELQGCFSDTYVAYYCLFSGAATTTSSSSPFIRFLDSSNNALSTSDYKYAGVEHTGGSGGAGAYFYHTTSAIQPMHTSSMGNSTNLPFDIHMWFSDMTDSGHKPHYSWLASGFFHGYTFGWTSGAGGYDVETAPAGLHFAMNGGNIREYNIRIWGRKA
tara:strand:+ start:1162 stop:2145 length:984 start_codon:yes stop_codon:yes gene_type:complete